MFLVIDLSSLIQKLMVMTDVDNKRERMTCIALIAKALLHQSWGDYSILLYLDMIRDVKLQKGFVASVDGDSDILTPASIVDDKKQGKPLKIYSEQGKLLQDSIPTFSFIKYNEQS